MKVSEKKMSQGKLVGNIAILVAMTIALIAPAGAQTWQSLGKSAVIPVVVENTVCNSSTDTVGITADRKVFLSCQSGKWAKAGEDSFSLAPGKMGVPSAPKFVMCDYGGGVWGLFSLYESQGSGAGVGYVMGAHSVYYTVGTGNAYWSSGAGDCAGQNLWTLKAAGRAW